MKNRFLALLTAALVSASAFAGETNGMIEVDRSGTADVGLRTAEGVPLAGRAVRINQLDSQTLSVASLDDTGNVIFVWSIRLSYPQIVSASLGVIIGDVHCGESLPFCGGEGLLIQVEPGVNGGKASLGYAFVLGMGSNGFMGLPLLGYDVKATILQTWGTDVTTNTGDTFAGIEADFTYAMIKFSLGLLYRVAGNDPSNDWLFTAGIGFGF